jgi:predicted amidohydrolase
VLPEFSLTGAVDPRRAPHEAVPLDHPAVESLARATAHGPGIVFGVAERAGDELFITQVIAREGRIAGVQRKRHLGEGEDGYSTGTQPLSVSLGARRLGVIICAESTVDVLWDATHRCGAEIICMCSAPGLHGRRRDEQAWRAGLAWWEGAGLSDARRHARRLGVWVALSTQAGATADEDFPGIAALVGPEGDVVDRLPDWRPGSLVVDVPSPRAPAQVRNV